MRPGPLARAGALYVPVQREPLLAGEIPGRDHDDRDVAPGPLRAQPFEKPESVHLGVTRSSRIEPGTRPAVGSKPARPITGRGGHNEDSTPARAPAQLADDPESARFEHHQARDPGVRSCGVTGTRAGDRLSRARSQSAAHSGQARRHVARPVRSSAAAGAIGPYTAAT